MRRAAVSLLAAGLTGLFALAANAQEIDWKKVDSALGKSAAVSDDVHRYGYPRSALPVTLDRTTTEPAFQLVV